MNKKRWFVSAFVLLFAAVLVGQVNAATTATGGLNAIIPGDPFAVPSDIIIKENFGTVLESGTDIFIETVDVPPSGYDTYWGYKNVWIEGAAGFNALFPEGLLQDANFNGNPDIYDLAAAVDSKVPARGAFGFPDDFFFGHPVAVAGVGYQSIFDVVVDHVGGDTLGLTVARSTSFSNAGQIVIPMSATNLFYVDARDVGVVDGPTPFNANVGGGTGVTDQTIQIATFFNVADVFGGTGQGVNVTGQVSASAADAFGVRLDVSPAQAVSGQLYLAVEAPALLPGYVFFRPVTLPTAGQYVYLAASNGTYLEDAASLYYKTGDLTPTDPDQFFIIGLDGLAGLTLKISALYKEDGESLTTENLTLIQSVTVTVTE